MGRVGVEREGRSIVPPRVGLRATMGFNIAVTTWAADRTVSVMPCPFASSGVVAQKLLHDVARRHMPLHVRSLPTARPTSSGQPDANPARRRQDAERAYRQPRDGRRRSIDPRTHCVLGQATGTPRASRQSRRPDDQPKIYGALHARIPIVTPDEQRALKTRTPRLMNGFGT